MTRPAIVSVVRCGCSLGAGDDEPSKTLAFFLASRGAAGERSKGLAQGVF